MKHSLARRLAATTSVAVAAGAISVVGLAAPASAAPADSTAEWIAGELDGNLMMSEYSLDGGETYIGFTDYGLTLDVYLGLKALGLKEGKQRKIIDAIEPMAADYYDAFGGRYAGALGKLSTSVLLSGGDPTDYNNTDLIDLLEGQVVDGGTDDGRGTDSPDDFSNTIGQSFVATGLAGAASPRALSAIDFLVTQQCAEGYFRESMDSVDGTCDGGSDEQKIPSLDATAFAVVALAAIDSQVTLPGVGDAVAAGAKYLAKAQKDNGTFVGGNNANTTGLAAVALAAGGKAKKAERAAEWVADLKVTKSVAKKTKYKQADVGAVALDKGAYRLGKDEGITRDTRDQFLRATAQALPALGLLS